MASRTYDCGWKEVEDEMRRQARRDSLLALKTEDSNEREAGAACAGQLASGGSGQSSEEVTGVLCTSSNISAPHRTIWINWASASCRAGNRDAN